MKRALQVTVKVDCSRTHGEKASENLVLLLHGLNSGPENLAGLVRAIREELPSSYILTPQLPLAWHHRGDLEDVVSELLTQLRKLDLKPYRQIWLIGHSIGGVLVQSAYLSAVTGQDEFAALIKPARLILIAPLNRGWSLGHHVPITVKLMWSVGLMALPLMRGWEWLRSVVTLRPAREPWALQVRKHAPFLVRLRNDWINFFQRNGEFRPNIVQLLGSRDELVSWRDMVEPALDKAVHYLQVPNSDHKEIIQFDSPLYGQERKQTFLEALGEGPWEPFEPWDTDLIRANDKVERVVFVIHGIRDEGHWTQKIASRARQIFAEQDGKSRDQIEVVTSSYGYFPMLHFLMARKRREKIHWLVEEYMEARRRYPNAKFSFIGHSNGTYLAAHALKHYKNLEFERLAFAGSVVSSRFRWKDLSGQVGQVLNYAATADWVVAVFPQIADVFPPVRFLFGAGLGGAGIRGFAEALPNDERPSNIDPNTAVQNLRFKRGSHDTAIREDNWDALAQFAVLEPSPFPFAGKGLEDEPVVPFRRAFLGLSSALGWVVTLVVIGLLLFAAGGSPARFWATLGAAFAILFLAIVLREFWRQWQERRPVPKLSWAVASAVVSSQIAAVAAVVILVWLASRIDYRWSDLLGSRGEGALRASSVFLCGLGIYRILTRF